MKSFSKSTIFGLTLGVLLAGYAVFVFTPIGKRGNRNYDR